MAGTRGWILQSDINKVGVVMFKSTDFQTFEAFLDKVISEPDECFDTYNLISGMCIDGLLLEFGVASGLTVKKLNDCFNGTRTIHGFDSFNGLPEDWRHNYPAGTFACELPEVPENIILHVGLFQDTLKGFLEATPGNIGFLHLDADLYSSTDYVLRQLEDRLVSGSLVFYDELVYPSHDFKEHEYKAFVEHHARTGLHYEYIGRRNPEAFAFKVI